MEIGKSYGWLILALFFLMFVFMNEEDMRSSGSSSGGWTPWPQF